MIQNAETSFTTGEEDTEHTLVGVFDMLKIREPIDEGRSFFYFQKDLVKLELDGAPIDQAHLTSLVGAAKAEELIEELEDEVEAAYEAGE